MGRNVISLNLTGKTFDKLVYVYVYQQFADPVMKHHKSYSLKKDLRHNFTHTHSIYSTLRQSIIYQFIYIICLFCRLNETAVTCRTPNKDNTGSYTLDMRIDNYELNTSSVVYIPDPVASAFSSQKHTIAR